MQNYSFSQNFDQNKTVLKGQILYINTPSINNEFKYVFREGYAYGQQNHKKSALFEKVTKTDGIYEFGGFNVENISLYVDSIIIIKNKIFLECYIIDKDGFLHDAKGGVIRNEIFDKRFLIVDLDQSVKSGEIEITTNFYEEPYSFKRPKRVLERFVEENSTIELAVITLLYFCFVLLLIQLSEKNNLNNEIQMGLVNDLEPEELLRSDLNRYWLYRLYDANPKLGLIFWDWKNDESKLMKGNTEYLKKYNVKDIQQVKKISDFISKVKNTDPTLSKEWDKVDNNMESALRAAREDLNASDISTKDLDATLERFLSPEQEENLKILIDYLNKVTNQRFPNSN